MGEEEEERFELVMERVVAAILTLFLSSGNLFCLCLYEMKKGEDSKTKDKEG